ncbi:hypothetical protein [Streptomyces sp. URMC 129]|uniref:hypothetical protein n=1 Tax=Streptomyces sp. URMC 129 TaxID=3423407 RepID=UPI003F1AEB1E
MARKRSGLARFLSELAESSKDFADEVIDRLEDSERHLRKALKALLEDRDHDHDHEHDRGRGRDREDALVR